MAFVICVFTVILIFDKNDTDSKYVKHCYKNPKSDCTVKVAQTPRNFYIVESTSYITYTRQFKIGFQIK